VAIGEQTPISSDNKQMHWNAVYQPINLHHWQFIGYIKKSLCLSLWFWKKYWFIFS